MEGPFAATARSKKSLVAKSAAQNRSMDNYEHIYYLDCPHFTVGDVDQWGEHGYLLFEDMVYAYEEDRKDQCGRTYSPVTVAEFLIYADKNQIPIPADFMKKLDEVRNK